MLGSASAAPAQSLPEPRFTTFSPREAGGPVAVADRPQPLYEPAGIPAGSFRIFPSVQAGLFLDSNVFQSRVSQDQDAALFLRPRVEARNDWATGELRLWADSTIRRYASNGTENSEQIAAGLRARHDLRRGAEIAVAADAGRFIEERTSNFTVSDTLKPVVFDRIHGSVLADLEFGRARLAAAADVTRWAYHDARSRFDPSVTIVQRTRTRTEVEPRVQLSYDLSPDTSLILGASYNQRNYDLETPVDRSSHGARLAGGFRMRPSPLVHLGFAAGYMWQNYETPLRSVRGVYAEADARWYPTELTTVSARLARDVSEAGAILTSGVIATRAAARVDHEYLRNVILSAGSELEWYRFPFLDRRDFRYTLDVTGRYRMNRRMELNGRLSYLKQSSNGLSSALDFSQARFTVSLTLMR